MPKTIMITLIFQDDDRQAVAAYNDSTKQIEFKGDLYPNEVKLLMKAINLIKSHRNGQGIYNPDEGD